MENTLERAVYKNIQLKYVSYLNAHPDMTPTERFIVLNRLMEKAHFGVTSRDLSRGFEVEYVQDEDAILKLTNRVQGHFHVGGPGNDSVDADPKVIYQRTKWDVERRLTLKDYMIDCVSQRQINLAQEEHYTSTDVQGAGTALIDHLGIDTGYGATPGVILPQFVNMMLRKVAEKTVFTKFCRTFPMPAMNFTFPLKTTKPSDDTSAVGPTLMPTKEGRAGLDYAMSFSRYQVNGWKHLRHAVLSVELIDLLREFLNIQGEYTADLAELIALLWDYSIAEGLWSMIWAAKWRRPDVSGAAWADSEYVPLAGASGANILLGNHQNHMLYQDLKPGSSQYGYVYNPVYENGVSDATEYLTATLRDNSGAGDDIFELIGCLGTLLKNKGSEIQYVAWPPIITEFLIRDGRFLETIQATGNPAFQSETGYLGQIAVGGSNKRVDCWEYDGSLLSAKATTDSTPYPITGIFAGKYADAWNLGVYSAPYLRVDDGREVVARVDDGSAVSTVRPNETRILTVGSRGSSFPGNYADIVLGLAMLTKDHG
jgi:hypothetical protein